MAEDTLGHRGGTVDRPPAPEAPPADDGVDVTLIRWMLSLSPRERLAVLQRNAASLLRLRDARTGTCGQEPNPAVLPILRRMFTERGGTGA